MFRRRHEKVVEKEFVYVPVTIDNYKPKAERWKKVSYLESVVGFASNQIYRMELFDALLALRIKADECKNPDTLHGINEGIKAFNELITMPFKALKAIDEIKSMAAVNDKLL